MPKFLKNRKIEILGLTVILLVTFFIYLNHFDNPFFFDDVHTISENESIKTLDNWTDFFTDASTFSSLPPNQSYRPIITLKNAIDYHFGGGLNPNFFHYHIFLWFLVLIVLVYFLSQHVYSISIPKNPWIPFVALFSAAWFALHTANAETINYICARSDSFSTLCIVASLLLYIHPVGRKWYLYLITAIIGLYTKQTGVMFFPILVVYVVLFEEQELIDHPKTETFKKIILISKKIAPTAIVLTSLFLINQYYLTPESTVSTNYTITRFEYISTQFFVILHYLGNFILPINLSADPDITIIKPWYDLRIILGIICLATLVFIMIKTSLKKELRPFAFGLAWFFIALLPTTLNPLFQIANDHRVFFPFIGLFIAIPWGFIIIVNKFKPTVTKKFKILLLILIGIILIPHSYGTMQRNEIWSSQESLWKDVTIKSPKNGRGLMNYGLTHMTKGGYDEALEYFNKALVFTPNYYSLHINLAIVYGAKNNHKKAKEYFKSAIALNSNSPAPEYYYARYLFQQKKYHESEKLLKKALSKSPNHSQSKKLISQVIKKKESPDVEIINLQKRIKTNPSPENYINLSLKYYERGDYQLVITTCQELLDKFPKNAAAYNNICSAYNQMKKWNLGAEACKKALEINPDYQLAKNNLKWAKNNIN